MLVFADGDRSMGLMVDEIVDVVEDRLEIELSRRPARPARQRGDRRPGHRRDRHRLLADPGLRTTGSAAPRSIGHARASARVLVVEDSDFFRQLAGADPRRGRLPA